MRLGFALPMVLATVLGTLAGCGQARMEDRLIACPNLTLPADLADFTRNLPDAPPDLSTLVADARIAGVDASCRPGRSGQTVDATIALRFRIDRGPAAQGRGVQLPWFIAVLDNTDTVVSRQGFVSPAQFAPNTTRANVSSQPINISFAVNAERRASDYRIIVGFDLTQEQLAQNRRRGPR